MPVQMAQKVATARRFPDGALMGAYRSVSEREWSSSQRGDIASSFKGGQYRLLTFLNFSLLERILL
jgi:hypothetical protein